jgi:predicted NBD/HSP70 family sugar kinase
MATSATARQINEARVLQSLFEVGSMSRADIARKVGLTKATMTNVIGDLLRAGWIHEGKSTVGTARKGRPGINVRLNPSAAYFLGVEIGVEHLRVLALDLTAQIVGGEITVKPNERRSAEAACVQVEAMVKAFIHAHLPPAAPIMGLCISFPGFIDRNAVVVRAPKLGWRDVPAFTLLAGRYPFPVAVENDANLAAFAEWYTARPSPPRDLLLVSVAEGTGGGLISGGRIVRGAHGLAGEVGHLVVDERSAGGFTTVPVAWQELIGRKALLDAYAARAGQAVGLAGFIELLRQNDTNAMEVARIWAKWLARGFLALTYAHDPDRIVVGGELAPVFELLRTETEMRLRRELIDGFPMPTLCCARLGTEIRCFGAAAIMHADYLRAFQSERMVAHLLLPTRPSDGGAQKDSLPASRDHQHVAT